MVLLRVLILLLSWAAGLGGEARPGAPGAPRPQWPRGGATARPSGARSRRACRGRLSQPGRPAAPLGRAALPAPYCPPAPRPRSLPWRAVETRSLPRGLPRPPTAPAAREAGVASGKSKVGRSGGQASAQRPGRELHPSSPAGRARAAAAGWRSSPPPSAAHPPASSPSPCPVADSGVLSAAENRRADSWEVAMFAAGLVYCSLRGEAIRTDSVLRRGRPRRGSGHLPLV